MAIKAAVHLQVVTPAPDMYDIKGICYVTALEIVSCLLLNQYQLKLLSH